MVPVRSNVMYAEKPAAYTGGRTKFVQAACMPGLRAIYGKSLETALPKGEPTFASENFRRLHSHHDRLAFAIAVAVTKPPKRVLLHRAIAFLQPQQVRNGFA
jgi:hypothetical protein